MALDQQMLHLSVGETQRPVHSAIVITPPQKTELNHYSHQDHKDLKVQPDVATSPAAWAEDPMHRIYRHTPTPTLVLDSSLRVIEVSDSHLAFFHLTREQLLHACVYELDPHSVPAPDLALLSGALGMAIATRAAQVIDTVHLLERQCCFSLRMTPIFEGDTLIYMLLEAQRTADKPPDPEEICEQTYLNETYKILVDTVKDYAIFMLDTQGNIATWNSGAAILKGYSFHEIIGEHFSIFYGNEDRLLNKPAKELEVCLKEGRVEDEGWRYRKDGGRFWANVMMTPIYQYGRHVGFVKVTRDLTERKAAEKRMIDAFEESSKLKTNFLANMSHEIRTPMNGMSLALALLMRTPLNDVQREYAGVLEDSTSILLQVINDVLDYSKLSSGSFSLNGDVLSVPGVVNAVVRNCKSSLKPGVTLETSIAPGFPSSCRSDPLRFRQIVQNLVSNAVKFTEQGYVRVHAAYAVDEHDPQRYQISVEVVDSGVGVPEDAVNTLFTPFTRFADSATKLYQGTGLGLSICKSLAELMDGAVGFHPNPDRRGSVFWMTARVGRVDMLDKPASPQSSQGPPGAERELGSSELLQKIAPQKHILLVEDNKVNQTIMLKLLNSLGFGRVDAAWDGAEAVRMVKQKQLTYNVILMDINMPVMDGLTATMQIRDMNVDVPIIALTGNALKGDAETYLAHGMNDYIAKPLHRQQLVDMLWKLFEP